MGIEVENLNAFYYMHARSIRNLEQKRRKKLLWFVGVQILFKIKSIKPKPKLDLHHQNGRGIAILGFHCRPKSGTLRKIRERKKRRRNKIEKNLNFIWSGMRYAWLLKLIQFKSTNSIYFHFNSILSIILISILLLVLRPKLNLSSCFS